MFIGCGSLIKAFLLTFNPLDFAYKKSVYSKIHCTLTISKKQMKYFTAGFSSHYRFRWESEDMWAASFHNQLYSHPLGSYNF
jgi:hypothetical protein